ncbi:MFS transporter [Sporobolomyces salmoneus]|uniref:MFS transporter n=1 Tax=Sporobolomyces salmoneus TaxID=183962 RepID=UPI003178AF66
MTTHPHGIKDDPPPSTQASKVNLSSPDRRSEVDQPTSESETSPTTSTPTLYQPKPEMEESSEEDQPVADSVGKDLTKQSSSLTPPYTIYSNSVRWFIISLVATAAMMSPLSANIYLPVIPAISQDLRVSTQSINLSVTVYMLAQGISPSFFGAICDVLGRRPVYIINFFIYMGACAGLANTQSYGELLGFRILQAVGSASVIAIGSGSIGDVAPPAQRGSAMAIFGLGAMAGTALGPIAGGGLADAFGWRSLFWFLFALGGVILIAIILFLPETLRSLVGNGSIPARGVNVSLLSLWQQHRRARESSTDALSVATIERPPKKTWKDVRPFAPLKMFREKDVLTLLTFNSATYSLFYSVTASTGTVFKDVYELSETDIGLCYLANGIGCLLAAIVNSKRSTYDYKWVERRQKEKEEQARSEGTLVEEKVKDLNDLSNFPIEQARLRSLPYYFVALMCSCIAYGWLVNYGVHLAAPLIMQFIIGLTVTSMFNMASTLMVDLYPGQGASATAANNLYRCLAGAGILAFIDPLINRMGVGWAFTFLTLLNACFLPLVWLEVKYGMKWRIERRERTKAKKARLEEKKRMKLEEKEHR